MVLDSVHPREVQAFLNNCAMPGVQIFFAHLGGYRSQLRYNLAIVA